MRKFEPKFNYESSLQDHLDEYSTVVDALLAYMIGCECRRRELSMRNAVGEDIEREYVGVVRATESLSVLFRTMEA